MTTKQKKCALPKWLLVVFIFMVSSCNQQMKFDKDKWNEQTDPIFPSSYRPKMLEDLTTNHQLIGLSYRQLTARLGQPDKKDLTIKSIASFRILKLKELFLHQCL